MFHALLALALAGPTPEQLARADYLADVDRGRALAFAADLVAENPDAIRAHRAYIRARATVGDAALTETQYRLLYEREPTDLHRAAYAHAIRRAHGRKGPWCEDARSLVADDALEPTLAYEILLMRIRFARVCSGTAEKERGQMHALAAVAPDVALGRSVMLRVWDDAVDAQTVRDLGLWLKTSDHRFFWTEDLWKSIDGDTREERKARNIARAYARRHAASTDPGTLWAAAQVLAAADDPKREAVLSALRAVDPEAPERFPLRRREWLFRDVIYADRQPTHEAALEALAAIEPRVPDSGEARSALESARSRRYAGLGRADDALAAAKRAWQATPEDIWEANAFAWMAAEQGRDLDDALKAIDGALETLAETAWDRSTPYDDWAEAQRGRRANWLDTRGWVQHKLGDHEGAARTLRTALAHDTGAELHAHLGLVYHALEEALAWEHLVRAHVDGLDEPELATAVEDALNTLWKGEHAWHPDGLEGYLAARRAAREDSSSEVEAAPEGPHPLVGAVFPIDAFQELDGGSGRLSTHDGPIVVDLWATWCTPCVQAMPHLQAVAANYRDRDVRVVGLSVDKNIALVEAFFAEAEAPAYEVGFIGEGGFESARVSGIPAVFVLDGDRRVVEFLSGNAGPNDHRLEDALDALLASQAKP